MRLTMAFVGMLSCVIVSASEKKQTEADAVRAIQGCRAKITEYRQHVAWTNGRSLELTAHEACAYRPGWPYDLSAVRAEIVFNGKVEARFEGLHAMLSLETHQVVFDETAKVELLSRSYALAGVAIDWRLSEIRSVDGFYARWKVDGPMKYLPVSRKARFAKR